MLDFAKGAKYEKKRVSITFLNVTYTFSYVRRERREIALFFFFQKVEKKKCLSTFHYIIFLSICLRFLRFSFFNPDPYNTSKKSKLGVCSTNSPV